MGDEPLALEQIVYLQVTMGQRMGCNILFSSTFLKVFEPYLVQKGESKPSHHHGTPPHPTPPKNKSEPLLQVPLQTTKHVLVEGWVEGIQIVLFFKLYPVWQQHICMILTIIIIRLIVCVKLQLKKRFCTPVWWLWWHQIIQWHYQRSQWSKPSNKTRQVF